MMWEEDSDERSSLIPGSSREPQIHPHGSWMSNLFQSFLSDVKVKEFVPLKILEFITSAALFSFSPFLSIHARDIGITPSQYGLISVISTFLCFPMPTLTGMFADKIGNFQWLLSISMLLNGMTALLYLTVPRMDRVVPGNTTIELQCTIDDPSSIALNNLSMIYSSQLGNIHNQCNYDCFLIRDLQMSSNTSSNACKITRDCQLPSYNDAKVLTGLEENESYIIETDVRIYNSTYFLVFSNDCSEDNMITNLSNDTIDGSSCWHPCEGSLNAHNSTDEEVITNYNILAIYALFRMINAVLLASSMALRISATVSVLKEKSGDLGFQIIYGKIGIMIFTPLTGVLIDYMSTENDENYSPAFYVYFALNVIGALVVLVVNLEYKTPSQAIFWEAKELMKKPEVALLFVISIILGMALGLLDTFFFWLLEDLGANKSLMGTTITVGTVSGIIIYFLSTKIIKKFGCADCISFAIAIFSIRFLGYSIITNPWWAMPFEALECFTMTLMSVAGMTYAAILCTRTTEVTIQSINLGAYSAGMGIGALLGGVALDPLGIRNTFRIMSVVCAITCIIYTMINKLFIKKKATSLSQTDYDTKKYKPDNETLPKEIYTYKGDSDY